jgi:mRNA-degrading endonuclease RelE of RelBE toxin-antitoxin system
MKIDYLPNTEKALADAPFAIRKAFFKQLKLLEQNLHHPSLHAKKYDESRDLWQARVNKDWRFYFVIRDDVYIIVTVVPHPKERTEERNNPLASRGCFCSYRLFPLAGNQSLPSRAGLRRDDCTSTLTD